MPQVIASVTAHSSKPKKLINFNYVYAYLADLFPGGT